MNTLSLLILLLPAGLACHSSSQEVSPKPEIDERIDLLDFEPLITIRGGGRLPLNVALSVGTRQLLIAKDALDLLGSAQRVGEGVSDLFGIRTLTYRVEQIRCGSYEFRDVIVDVIERHQSPHLVRTGLDGFLGIDLFGNRFVTLDFMRRKLQVSVSNGSATEPWVPLVKADSGGSAVEVSVGAQSGKLAIDLSTTPVCISPAFHARCKLGEPKRSAKAKDTLIVAVPSVRISGYDTDRLVVVLEDLSTGIDGRLGSEVICKLGGLTIDIKNRRVQFPYRKPSDMYTELEKQSDAGQPWAQFALYDLTRNGMITGIEGDVASLLRRAAKSGYVPAMFELGERCYRGDSEIPKNEKQAHEVFSHLANLESPVPEAVTYLGEMYSLGIGVEKDEGQANRYYHRASELGSLKAQIRIGLALLKVGRNEEDIQLGRQLLSRGAVRGNTEAYVGLGECYRSGIGVQKNLVLALQCLEAAAERGSAEGMFLLGEYHAKGWGGTVDYSLGRKWYERASNLNHVGAKRALSGQVPR